MSDLNSGIPTREELDSSAGIILLEFGSEFCGYCQSAKAYISQSLSENPDIRHIKIEDGPGKKLGRSFKVKLWPTLILLQDGKEISRVVRPEGLNTIQDLLNQVIQLGFNETIQSNCRELLTDQDWILGWQALTTLRPKLKREDFLARKNQLQLDGYHLVGLFKNGKVASVASYTVSPHPVFEREMIIHDMSTLVEECLKGYGTKLLSYLDQLAIQLNCKRTFLASAKASEFYIKNGYTAHATALKKLHAANF